MAATMAHYSQNVAANISNLLHAGMGEGQGASEYFSVASVAPTLWPVAATCVTLFAFAYLLRDSKPGEQQQSDFPAMGSGSMASRFKQFAAGGGWDHYYEGHNKYFRNRIFRVANGPKSEHIVIPIKFLPELNALPDTVLNFEDLLREEFEAQSRHFSREGDAAEGGEEGAKDWNLKLFSKAALSTSLPQFTALMLDGVSTGLRHELPDSDKGWEEVNIYRNVARVVMRTCGRMFLGTEIAQTSTFLDIAPRYTNYYFHSTTATAALPTFLRPLIAPYLPQVRRWKKVLSEMKELLRPPIAQRLQEMGEQGENFQKPDDVLQRIIETVKAKPGDGRKGEDSVAVLQFAGTTASIESPLINIMNAVYSLAADPELLPMLREDIQQAMDTTGGEINNVSLQKMYKLESFIKEVMRLYPMRANTFQRKIRRTFTLSDGQVIPAGAVIEVAWAGIKEDPELYPEPQRFDALRFYRMRMAEAENSTEDSSAPSVHRLIGTSTSNLSWGFGKHACPGRYFAANLLKVVISAIILNYDLRMPDGVEGRYKNWRGDAQQGPDAKNKVLIRKI